MGISTALQAAHNDDLHTGNAKRAAASGLASLDAASKVVQEPATKGAASGIAPLDAGSKVAVANLPVNVANGIASLDAASKVVQEPASKGAASGIASLDAASKVVQEPASKGAASGIASLDASSRVPAAQLALAELLANKNAASGYAGLDAGSQVAQSNSFLAVPSLGVAKALDTEYQNGARPRLIIVTLRLNVGATGASIVIGRMNTKSSAGVASTDKPTVVANNEYGSAIVASTALDALLVKVIPASWYYKLTTFVTGTGAVTMISWDEIDL